MAKWMSQSQAARELSRHRSTIQEWIAKGHVRKNDKGQVNFDDCLRFVEKVADPRRVAAAGAATKRHNAKIDGMADDVLMESDNAKLTRARADKEEAAAELARIKADREAGKVVDVAVVAEVLAELGKTFQAKMMAWTPRFMARMSEPSKAVVKEEIRLVIAEYHEALQKIVGEVELRAKEEADEQTAE